MSGLEPVASARAPFDRRSVLAGVIAIILGFAAIAEGRRYAVGTLLRMGPGFFPILLGVLLLVLGLVLAIAGATRPGSPAREAFLWRPVIMIPIALALFAIAAPRFGLAPAIFALVLVSSLSEPEFKPLPVLTLATGMTLAVWTLFAGVLGLPYPLLDW